MSKNRQLADLLDSNGDVVVGALDNAPDPDLTPYATTTYVDTEISGISTDAITEGNSSVEVVDTGADGRVVLTTEGAERARVDASGNLMVGTTSTNNAKFRFSGGDMKLDSFTRYAFGGDPDYAYMESVNEGSQNVGLAFGTTTVAGEGIERVRITHDGEFRFNSGYGSVATAYGCRAWVNFNGSGAVAIRASGNVSSITDHGTGDYTVNFTNAMPDTNYTTTHAGGQKTVTWGIYLGYASYGSSTTGHRFYNVTPGDTVSDTSYCSLAFFR